MKKISRQREWQLKKVKEGLCYICGRRKIYKVKLCRTHYKTQLARNKKWHDENLEKHLLMMKQWREKNKK